MGIVAFYIASFWFFCNVFGFSTNEACGQQGAKNTLEYLSARTDVKNVVIGFLSGLPGIGPFFGSILGTNFFRLFLESAFVLFLLSSQADGKRGALLRPREPLVEDDALLLEGPVAG